MSLRVETENKSLKRTGVYCAYYENNQAQAGAPIVRKPLFIGSSGGSGAIMSVEGIRNYLIANHGCQLNDLPQYAPVLPESKDNFAKRFKLKAASFLINDIPAISMGIRAGLAAATDYPRLPDNKSLNAEVKRLRENQLNSDGNPKLRYYMDMALDGLALGYQYIAIHNILQTRHETKQLHVMLKHQAQVDNDNYDDVYAYIFHMLNDAHEHGTPYSEVIATQNLCIPAICDAVIAYNRLRQTDIKVHQYLSDIATDGNHGYWGPLNRLSPAQRQAMIVYGVNLTAECRSHLHLATHGPFHHTFDIDPDQNPMLRSAFKDKANLETYLKKPGNIVNLRVQVANGSDKSYQVGADEKVASIMLGSLAGDDTVGYATELAKLFQSHKHSHKCVYDKIFVFGGTNPRIKQKLTKQIDSLAKRQRILGIKGPTVILLDNQDDVHSAPIRVRSDLTILRGGGMTVMEEMAMPHHPDQQIYFHANRNRKGQFTTGINWEDANIRYFREYMKGSVNKIEMTSLREIEHELVRRNSMNRFYRTVLGFGLIQKMPDGNFCVEMLEELSQKINYYSSLPQDDQVQNFLDSLNALHTDLHSDYLQMKAKGRTDRKMIKSTSMKIAAETIKLLDGLKTNEVKESDIPTVKRAKYDNAVRLIYNYEKSVSKISGINAFGKAVAAVVITAIGFALGAVIGSAIGFFAGAWSGPGAIVTSVIGLFKGAYSGAALGLVVGAAATGISSGSIASALMFKPNKRAKDAKRVAKQAKEYNKMKLGQ